MTESQQQEPRSTGMVEVLGRGLVPAEQIRRELLRWSIGEDVARQANAEHRVHPTQVAVVHRAVMPATMREAKLTAAAGLTVFVLGSLWHHDVAGVMIATAIGALVGVWGPWRAIVNAKRAIPLVRVDPIPVRLGHFPGLAKPGEYLLPAGDPDEEFRGLAAIAHITHLPHVPPVVLSLDVDPAHLL